MYKAKFLKWIEESGTSFERAVPFNKHTDRLVALDFTETNQDLGIAILEDTHLFSEYVSQKISTAGAVYGIGGYLENRTVYQRSSVFAGTDTDNEPRSLHLGIDIWGKAGVSVFAPLDAVVHSYGFNNRFGDYGATIILQHQVKDGLFYSLYGHLSLKDLDDLWEGKPIKAGEQIAHFGEPAENGSWPPHLHFQLILDMEGMKGDYPGVCKVSEREKYILNCPDPNLVLHMMEYAI